MLQSYYAIPRRGNSKLRLSEGRVNVFDIEYESENIILTSFSVGSQSLRRESSWEANENSFEWRMPIALLRKSGHDVV